MATLIAMMDFSNEAAAQEAYDALEARANLTEVVGLGTEGERTSYARLEKGDGTVTQFHIDTFGILRSGAYEPPPSEHPLWIDPGGDATKAYPATDAAGDPTRVEHNGTIYENVHGDGNVWEPGEVNSSIWQEVGTV